jgi:hypothetical protein
MIVGQNCNDKLIGTALGGKRYGRLDRYIPDAGVRKTYDELQKRLAVEIQRLSGRFDPQWAVD